MSKSNGELVSVKIIPNEKGNPAGKLADAEVIFEPEAGPLSGLKLIGFSVWERRTGGLNVTFPARQVLRERGTPELRAVATRERGAHRAGTDSGRDPRGVQPFRGADLNALLGICAQADGPRSAAWAAVVRITAKTQLYRASGRLKG